jgi:site-specific DNA-methyltransferase (adenine-specific)
MDYMKGSPDKVFDLAIVDPPYGLGLEMITKVDSNARQERNNRSVVSHVHKSWNDEVPTEEYFRELHRISVNQIIWGCNYYAKYIPAVGRIIHDKIMGTEKTKFGWSHADLASCSMFNRIVMFRYQWAGNKQNGIINWKNTGTDARIHPTQKPVALYKWLLKNYAKEGDKIFDSHGGSMSIAIACHDAGLDLTLCEIDKDYYDAGVKRFENHKKQLNLF